MAGRGTLHRIEIALSDVDRDVYETLDLRVARHPSETDRHVVLRTLAYALLFAPGIGFSKGGVSEGDAPPLSITEGDGRLVTWIEIGPPSAERLRKAVHRADAIVIVVSGEADAGRAESARAEAGHAKRCRIIVLAPGLVDALVVSLDRRVAWTLVRSDDVLHAEVGGETHAGPLSER